MSRIDPCGQLVGAVWAPQSGSAVGRRREARSLTARLVRGIGEVEAVRGVPVGVRRVAVGAHQPVVAAGEDVGGLHHAAFGATGQRDHLAHPVVAGRSVLTRTTRTTLEATVGTTNAWRELPAARTGKVHIFAPHPGHRRGERRAPPGAEPGTGTGGD